MRQMFNKKQLVVMWFVAVVVCFFILRSSIITGVQVLTIVKVGTPQWRGYNLESSHTALAYAVNWFRLSLIPVIIGALLVITLSKKKSPNEDGR